MKTTNQHIIFNAEGQAGDPRLARAVLPSASGRAGCCRRRGEVVEAPAADQRRGIDGEPGVFLMVQGQLGANTRAVTRARARDRASCGRRSQREA